MRKMFASKSRRATLFRPNSEEQEFGLAKGGVYMCPNCRCFYFKKAWHHFVPALTRGTGSHTVSMACCPACRMTRARSFEGELIIYDVPTRLESEVLHLIAAYGRRTFAADCQHRIIAVTKQRGRIVVTTSENQLAGKLAKKIEDTFHDVDVAVSYSKAPNDLERVRVTFVPPRPKRQPK